MIFTRRAPIVAALIAVMLAGTGLWLLAGAAPDLGRKHVVVAGVPLDEVHPAGLPTGERRPGVVVAHGFAGSARLMAQFGDTLAARGYVVVLLDFAGHGANTHPLPDGKAITDASNTALQRDLDVAMTHLRGLPDVDPARVALVGHSMGATAVTRYALAHPEVTATVAISLPDSSFVPPDRPARLLLLVGGLEFPAFRAAVDHAVEGAGSGRSAVVVPGVEHISILYAPRTHQETVGWLDDSFGGPVADRPLPAPMRRLTGAGLLLLALLIGLHPVARLLLGGGKSSWPRLDGGKASWPRLDVLQIGRAMIVAAVAAAVGLLVAPIAPTVRLPLALGGFIVGFTGATGVAMLAYQLWRGRGRERERATGRLRPAIAAPLLIGYAAATIAVPLQLGLTNAVPVGARWWLLACVWAGFAVLAYAAERVTDGNSAGVLAVSAVAVFALAGAAVVGLASSFLVLIVPLLAILLLWQAIWSAVLHRFAAPAWLIALVGSLIVAWPIATALPVIG